MPVVHEALTAERCLLRENWRTLELLNIDRVWGSFVIPLFSIIRLW